MLPFRDTPDLLFQILVNDGLSILKDDGHPVGEKLVSCFLSLYFSSFE